MTVTVNAPSMTEPESIDESGRDYALIAAVIARIRAEALDQPSLAELSRGSGLSPGRLQRLFRRWAGLSPKRFLQHLTLEAARERLRASASVLDASLDIGLSGPSRLHDLLVTFEGVSPGELKSGGAGLTLRWGCCATPFGEAFLAASPRGLCALSFLEADGPGAERAALAARWPEARLVEDLEAVRPLARRAFSSGPREELRLLVRGSAFELKVWRALLAIPPGAAASYARLAEAIGRPGSARAVGGAIGRNPVAVLIPCHRVLRADGRLGGYRWGLDRKQALLAREGPLADSDRRGFASRPRDHLESGRRGGSPRSSSADR